jgi:catechol 2,3-dioxygenase-like lactoylglutathione lyase family enzyme
MAKTVMPAVNARVGAQGRTLMHGIKVRDIAYGRLRSPDLDIQEASLTDFGMRRVARTATTLYMRGTDPAQYLHVTEKGDPALLGLGWRAKSEDDLRTLAKLPAASGVEHIDAPGGGLRVRLQDPNGYAAEIVYDIEQPAPIEVPRRPVNSGPEPLNRAGELMRIAAGPAAVKRIAHGVIFTPKFAETLGWYRATLGLVSSDDLYAGPEENVIASFNRVDCGDQYVDHHAFFCMVNDRAGLNHISFEVHDIDDVFIGHEYLAARGKYRHVWGVGRHLLGSQVYDYWEDPWGRVHEHWADSDRLNIGNGSNLSAVEDGLRSQWGEAPPAHFVGYVSP